MYQINHATLNCKKNLHWTNKKKSYLLNLFHNRGSEFIDFPFKFVYYSRRFERRKKEKRKEIKIMHSQTEFLKNTNKSMNFPWNILWMWLFQVQSGRSFAKQTPPNQWHICWLVIIAIGRTALRIGSGRSPDAEQQQNEEGEEGCENTWHNYVRFPRLLAPFLPLVSSLRITGDMKREKKSCRSPTLALCLSPDWNSRKMSEFSILRKSRSIMRR